MAEILLRLRDREVSRTPIATTRITLGRDPSSDVVIDNPAVSRAHATLIFVDNHFRIRDNSGNGLTVNGKGVKDAVLAYDDVIGIGKFELVLLKSEKEEPLQAGAPPKPAAPGSLEVTVRPPPRKERADGDKPADAADESAPVAAQAPAPAKKPRKITDTDIEWSTILKIAGGGLLFVTALLAGAIWALDRGLITLNL